ncbi:MAG: helix-turn-helix domain-containing protein [Undibacterium sp.]|nr:helix-turn-helix domain-containing protein [Undibacterium sp.]
MKTLPSLKAKHQDWHRADIKSALEKAGWTLAALGKSRGYQRGSLVNVLNTPYPKAERIIAEVLGTTPQTIWPSRYNQDGLPVSGRVRSCVTLFNSKFNTPENNYNVEFGGAN